jgi:hypothetical protein
MLIFCEHITPRVEYIMHQVFQQHFGLAHELTADAVRFAAYEGPGFCYASSGTKFIAPQGLLFEDDVRVQKIDILLFERQQYPFPVTPHGLLPFDIFSAIFYLVTRYEEYLPHKKNQYGQFNAADSLNDRCGWLHLPVVDIWLQQFKERLLHHYPGLPFREKKYSTLITYDIDTAYAFRGRSGLRSAMLAARDVLMGRWRHLKERLSPGKDPYDTYDHILDLSKQLQLPLLFFFLLGNRNQYNRNLNAGSRVLRQLIQRLRGEATIGIHPSYYADADEALLNKEKKKLEIILGQPVVRSRQHYLRLQWPHTYRQLCAAGIKEDYTMGYAEKPGFRAGTCTPFYWFDLLANKSTTLTIFPFAFMEGSFAEDMRQLPEQARKTMLQLLAEVKKVNGFFSCIWHNHTLSDEGFWKGWRQVHDAVCREAALHG